MGTNDVDYLKELHSDSDNTKGSTPERSLVDGEEVYESYTMSSINDFKIDF